MLYLRVDFDDILSPQGRHKTFAFLAVYLIVGGGLPKLINRLIRLNVIFDVQKKDHVGTG